jgi:hypothetical protein
MDKTTFVERLESEVLIDPEIEGWEDLFRLMLEGLALRELERTASRRDEDLSIVHRGDEQIGYWDISLGSCSATGPNFLGTSDSVGGMVWETEQESTSPALSPM